MAILQITAWFSRAALAAVLVVAGSAKLADLSAFSTTLIGIGLPARYGGLIRETARTIPLFELGVGIALVSGLWPPFTAGVTLALTLGFSLVSLIAWHRTPFVTCRCFGALQDARFTGREVVRTLVLTVLAGFLVWSEVTGTTSVAAAPLSQTIVLVAGYLLLGVAAAQAAKTMAALKVRGLA